MLIKWLTTKSSKLRKPQSWKREPRLTPSATSLHSGRRQTLSKAKTRPSLLNIGSLNTKSQWGSTRICSKRMKWWTKWRRSNLPTKTILEIRVSSTTILPMTSHPRLIYRATWTTSTHSQASLLTISRLPWRTYPPGRPVTTKAHWSTVMSPRIYLQGCQTTWMKRSLLLKESIMPVSASNTIRAK